MKAIKIVVVILLIAAMIHWLRAGQPSISFLECLPIIGGKIPDRYAIAGLMMGWIGWRGVARIRRST